MKYYSVPKAAKEMGVCRSVLIDLMAQRQIARTKIGQRWKISEQAISEWQERNTIPAKAAK